MSDKDDNVVDFPATDGRRSNKKRKQSYADIPRNVMDSKDFQSLGGNSAKLLLELSYQFKGKNNGDLTCTWTVLKEKGWKSKSTIERARNELLEKNLIIKTRESHFHSSRGRCALYALTWLPIDECNGKLDISPTNKPHRIFSNYYEQNNQPRNPRESRKEEDEPVWHVIRNEHSENFEAWVVTATSKTSGEVTSYGTFPNMGSVQLFLTYFNFDETKEQKHELFIIQMSKLNQVRVVPESALDWEKDWNQLGGDPKAEIVSWNQMAWDVYGNVSGEKNAMKKHEKKHEYEPEGDK